MFHHRLGRLPDVAPVHCRTVALPELDLAKAQPEYWASVLPGESFHDRARCNCALALHGLCLQRRWVVVAQLAQLGARGRRVVPGGRNWEATHSGG